MADKKYYWLKLKEDFFRSKRIKKLRNMAGGDTYTIIYLKMQLLALKTEGVLTWTGVEENFADELALDLDEKPEDVQMTIMYLLSKGLAETEDNKTFFLPYVIENTGSETTAAERMRKSRERNNVTQMCNNVTPLLHSCYTEIEKEIDKDIEIEREKEEEPSGAHRISDLDQVIEAWNALNLTKVTKVTADSQRGQWLHKRIKDYGLSEVLRAIDNVRRSKFLMGDNKKGWQITFDWFLRPNNFPKVLDGNYSDYAESAPAPAVASVPKNRKYTTAEEYKAEKAKEIPVSPDELWKMVDMI